MKVRTRKLLTQDQARSSMPQVRKTDWDELLDYARSQTTVTREDAVDPHSLHAVQSEWSQDRVDGIPMEKLQYPILVSRDGYVLDGNHRWIKAGQEEVTIPVLRLGLDRDDALELVRSFPKAEYVENSNPNHDELGRFAPLAAALEEHARTLDYIDPRVVIRDGVLSLRAYHNPQISGKPEAAGERHIAYLGLPKEGVKQLKKNMSDHAITDNSLTIKLFSRAKRKATRNVGPNRIDPTRTTSIRREFTQVLRRKFALLRGRVRQLVVGEDALGLEATANSNPEGYNQYIRGYHSYTREELVKMDSDLHDTWKQERRNSQGEGLRAEVAQAAVREIERQRKAINEAISKKPWISTDNKMGRDFSQSSDNGRDTAGRESQGGRKHGPSSSQEDARRQETTERDSLLNEADLLTNRFQFHSSPEKLAAFQDWIRGQMKSIVASPTDKQLWENYAKQGYAKGAGRAYEEVNKIKRFAPGEGEFYQGSRAEFMRGIGRPETVEKIQLLASRSFSDLENVTEDVATRMGRHLVDGVSQGMNPRAVARLMDDDLELGGNRAEVIARTEIIRAHAEGSLDSMKSLGVETVGAIVEFSTAGDGRVCSECDELEGQEFSIDDARGIIPVHPNCRCAWLPAGFDKTDDDNEE